MYKTTAHYNMVQRKKKHHLVILMTAEGCSIDK